MKIEFNAGDHTYTIDGIPVPSVTTVLKQIGDRFGPAAWWGMKVGARGVLELINNTDELDGFMPLTVETDDKVIPLLTKHKLTTNHVRDSAGVRGSAVHKAAEVWAKEKRAPNPADYHSDQRGYVRAFAHFVTEEKPEYDETETVVGSRFHKYAGTPDARARIGGRTCILDYKTSKGVYENHHLQLAAYELASRECEYPATEFQAIVHLSPEGEYDLVHSVATPEQWLSCLEAYRELMNLKDSLRETKRRAAA